MAMREQNDDRRFGNDRERPREVSQETRSASGANGDSDTATSGRARTGRSNRGFASMDRSKQREIASKGGRAAHAKGTAHEFNSNEARDAGRKGGVAVSRNREHMAAIGRKGGEARGAARRAQGTSATSQDGRDISATSSARGATQNTRSAPVADREVGIQGASQNSGGSVSSLGGERSRPVADRGEQNVERP
jgi:general stress protein YciG